MRQKLWIPILLALLATLGVSSRAQHKTIGVIVTAGHFKDRNVPSFMPNGRQVDADYIKAGIKSYFQRLPAFLESFKHDKDLWPFDRLIELSTELDTPADRLATRKNILEALAEVSRSANPGDTVVFYFSGHGGRRGSTFSLCPFDAALDSDGGDIQGAEIGTWVSGLKSDNVTLILDCCFNEYPAAKGIQPQRRPKFLARHSDAALADIRPVFPMDKAVILTASRQDEEAQQYQTGNGGWVGLFTDQLVREMEASSPDTTYQALALRTKNDLQRYVMVRFENAFSQTPEIMGSDSQRGRQLFQPASSAAGRSGDDLAAKLIAPHLSVDKLHGDRVEINAGSDQDVTVGSKYDVFPAGKPDVNKPSGKIEIVQVEKRHAVAKVTEGSGVSAGAPVVETTHRQANGEKHNFKIRIEAALDMKTGIEQTIGAMGQVELVRDHPALVLKVEGRPGEIVGQLFRTDGANAYGAPIQETKAASIADLAAAMRPRLDNLAFLRTLAALNNPNPGIDLRVDTEKTLHPFGEAFTLTVEALDPRGKQADCYITVIDIDANGTPQVIFPKSSDPDMRDNHLRREGDGSESRILRLTLQGGPPAGQDTLIAIATRQPVESLEALAAMRSGDGKSPSAKGIDAIREEFQQKPLIDWAKAMLTIIVLDPADAVTPPAGKPVTVSAPAPRSL